MTARLRELAEWMRGVNGHCADALIEILDAEGDGGAVEYFSANPAEGEFSTHKSLAEAVAGAKSLLEYAQDEASDWGWTDEPPQICYGVVLGGCIEKEGSRRPAPEGSDFSETVDFELTSYTHLARPGVVRDEDVEDAARWRFFCDNIGCEYGDGYTEPRENSACLEWQQGPWIRDGSNGGQGRADTFPGWSAIIDKMMEDERRSLEELDEPIDAAIKGERHG